MLQGIALPPSSGRLNLFTVVSGMVWRKECFHYVAVLGTIGPGLFSRCSNSLWAGRLEDRIPAAARLPGPVQTGPLAHPGSYTKGIRTFPGVNRLRRAVDHLPLLPEVNKRVELRNYCSLGPSWTVLCWNLLLHLLSIILAITVHSWHFSIPQLIPLAPWRRRQHILSKSR
jgi:hypothetical protein